MPLNLCYCNLRNLMYYIIFHKMKGDSVDPGVTDQLSYL